jgi:L-lactate dehydrogenase complex protein LldG
MSNDPTAPDDAAAASPEFRPQRPTNRDFILGAMHRALGINGNEPWRANAVAGRLTVHPRGPVPARGKLDPAGRVTLFREQATAAGAVVTEVGHRNDVPAAIADILRGLNLPPRLRLGTDPRFATLPWPLVPALEVMFGPSDGDDLVGVSFALAAVAESGTLVLMSGQHNPTTLNFLPDTHIVVVAADDVVGDYETVWDTLRARFGSTVMPRTVNWITGPSRSADIEQRLVFGAHGPRRLHIVVVG